MKIWGTLDPFLETGDMMGRLVANEEFFRALVAKDRFDAYHFFPGDAAAAAALGERLKQAFPQLWSDGRVKLFARLELADELNRTDYHCFHLSDCITNPANLARVRNACSRKIFPITSVTHSLSYARYTNSFLGHLWGGCTKRDCVVATSSTGVDVMKRCYEHLSQGFGLPSSFGKPTVVRIPLGVDVERLRPPAETERAQARRSMQLQDDQCMLLVFGRLSHQSKMDLLPALQAMKRLRREGLDMQRVRLVMAGAMEKQESYLRTLATVAKQIDLRLDIAGNPDETAKKVLFHAADVFLSPVDNPQETFGISVLEAGAFGLPAVASDYDGYRDLVETGVTGILIPTIGAPDTADINMSASMLFDNMTHVALAQQTVVNVPAMADALAGLINDPQRRKRMGSAARLRVERRFTWSKALDAYLLLWDKLWNFSVDEQGVRDIVHPLHPDYAAFFSSYPTSALSPDAMVRLSATGEDAYRKKDIMVVYGGLKNRVAMDTVRKLLFFSRKAVSVSELVDKLVEDQGLLRETARYNVLWALKHDFLEQVAHAGDDYGSGKGDAD